MFKLFCCIVVLASIWAPQIRAQNPRSIPHDLDMGSAMNPGILPPATQVDPAHTRWQFQAAQRENQNRQIALKQDTDKLLELATELKQNVDRSGPDILSLDVVKKAQEIEKLAKSVKDKMKGD
jgi:hypothetical protein